MAAEKEISEMFASFAIVNANLDFLWRIRFQKYQDESYHYSPAASTDNIDRRPVFDYDIEEKERRNSMFREAGNGKEGTIRMGKFLKWLSLIAALLILAAAPCGAESTAQPEADGGVYFETLIIDACMMANIETAWNVKDYAHWMTASQETVPGDGTAIQEWLQALVNHPSLGGDWLARNVCDMTEAKYTNMEDDWRLLRLRYHRLQIFVRTQDSEGSKLALKFCFGLPAMHDELPSFNS